MHTHSFPAHFCSVSLSLSVYLLFGRYFLFCFRHQRIVFGRFAHFDIHIYIYFTGFTRERARELVNIQVLDKSKWEKNEASSTSTININFNFPLLFMNISTREREEAAATAEKEFCVHFHFCMCGVCASERVCVCLHKAFRWLRLEVNSAGKFE